MEGPKTKPPPDGITQGLLKRVCPTVVDSSVADVGGLGRSHGGHESMALPRRSSSPLHTTSNGSLSGPEVPPLRDKHARSFVRQRCELAR